MPFLISIESNIGAGKTSFIECWKKDPICGSIPILEEPVQRWIDSNIFSLFYNDQYRWSYTFQEMVFKTRIEEIEKWIFDEKKNKDKHNNFIGLIERSVYCDRNCFVQMLHTQGKINNVELKVYDEWYSWLLEKTKDTLPIAHVYLRANPEICYKRIQKRKREQENNISLDYLIQLGQYHDLWLLNNDDSFNKNILIIDVNKDFIKDIDYQKEILNKVYIFIKKIININCT